MHTFYIHGSPPKKLISGWRLWCFSTQKPNDQLFMNILYTHEEHISEWSQTLPTSFGKLRTCNKSEKETSMSVDLLRASKAKGHILGSSVISMSIDQFAKTWQRLTEISRQASCWYHGHQTAHQTERRQELSLHADGLHHTLPQSHVLCTAYMSSSFAHAYVALLWFTGTDVTNNKDSLKQRCKHSCSIKGRKVLSTQYTSHHGLDIFTQNGETSSLFIQDIRAENPNSMPHFLSGLKQTECMAIKSQTFNDE